MFRLLPLLLLALGVAHHGNASQKRPIITASQQQRICADLCQAGLGGEPCGEVCFDLMPTDIPLVPVQSPNDTYELRSPNTRSQACPVLCENNLGYPLCQCTTPPPVERKPKKKFRVDFNKICDYYCEGQKWSLRGCPLCPVASQRQDGLLSMFQQDGVAAAAFTKMVNIPGARAPASRKIDWGKWCSQQCANSNGGSACNCDILPFSA